MLVCHIFLASNLSVLLRNVKRRLKRLKKKRLEVIGADETAGKTFKVEMRRTDKRFPLVTNELQLEIGSHVLRSFPEFIVQMKKPDIVLHIDIRMKELS